MTDHTGKAGAFAISSAFAAAAFAWNYASFYVRAQFLHGVEPHDVTRIVSANRLIEPIAFWQIEDVNAWLIRIYITINIKFVSRQFGSPVTPLFAAMALL